MERRKFLKSAGSTAAAALIAPQLSGSQTNVSAPFITPDSLPDQQVSVSVKNNKVFVETETLTASIDKGVLTSFKSKLTGEEFIQKPDTGNFRCINNRIAFFMPPSRAKQPTRPIECSMLLFCNPVNNHQAENPYSMAFSSSITNWIPEKISR